MALSTRDSQLKQQESIALSALKEFQFAVFLQALIAIGELQAAERKLVVDEDAAAEKKNEQLLVTKEQMFAFQTFAAVWNDKHNVTIKEKNTQYLAARNSFSDKRQVVVDDGLAYLDAKMSEAKLQNDDLALIASQEKQITEDDIKQRDSEAYKAIVSYQNYRQLAVHYLGIFLAGAMALVFGGIETGTAVALLLPTSWPLAVIYGLTVAVSVLATWMNWRVFKPYVPSLLKSLIGKNRYFDGITEYIHARTGQLKKLSNARTAVVAAFALLAALPTGIAIGALGYTATLSIGVLPFVGGVITAMGLNVLLAPLGIALAAIVAVAMTFLLTSSVTSLLQHNEDLVEAVRKPFRSVTEILEKNNASALKKGAAYLITGLLGLISLVGLGMACFTSMRSSGTFLINQFNYAPTLVTNLLVAVPAFVGRAWFTLKNALDTMSVMLKRVYSGEVKQESAPVAVAAQPVVAKPLSSYAMIDKLKKPVAAGVQAAQEAAFYASSLRLVGDPLELCTFAAVTAGIRTFTTNAAHLDDPEVNQVEVDAKAEAAKARVNAVSAKI